MVSTASQWDAHMGPVSLLSLDKPINYSARVTLEVQQLTIAYVDQRNSLYITVRQVQHCQAHNEG